MRRGCGRGSFIDLYGIFPPHRLLLTALLRTLAMETQGCASWNDRHDIADRLREPGQVKRYSYS